MEKDFSKLLPLLEKKRDEVLAKGKWKKIDLSKPFVVMPFTANCEEIVRILFSYGVMIDSICDNNSKLHGKKVESVVIHPVEYVQQLQPTMQIVIITKNPKVADQLTQQLITLGIEQLNIYGFYDFFDSVSDDLRKKIFYKYLLYYDISSDYDDHREIEIKSLQLLRLMNELRDERSINVLLSILASRYYDDFRIMSFVFDQSQYFTDFFPIRDNEVFIDAGAYYGDTASDFIKRANAKKYTVHSFEPNPVMYPRLCRTVSGNENIICHNAGLGLKNEVLTFCSSEVGSGKIDTNGDIAVQIVSVDSLDIAPTWIKADVEGNEIALLQGAQETIKKYKPRLSICVYHKLYDILEIPEYINSLVPDYHFFLRHHALNNWETVLYAALPGDYTL